MESRPRGAVLVLNELVIGWGSSNSPSTIPPESPQSPWNGFGLAERICASEDPDERAAVISEEDMQGASHLKICGLQASASDSAFWINLIVY